MSMGGLGRIYYIPLVRTAVSGPVDLAELVPTAAQILWLHRIELSQSTEAKDAEEEMLQLAWRVGNTTTGSGGNTGVIANQQLPGDPASGLTIKTFNTTKATVGTVITKTWDWNIRMEFDKIFTPETMLFVGPSTRACLELVAAPLDVMTISGTITVEVVG
jgi:hypothetical protein